jgi:hypothetical protein
MSRTKYFVCASLRCARACGSEEEVFFLCLPGIYASARVAHLGDVPGYYHPSRQGRDWGLGGVKAILIGDVQS